MSITLEGGCRCGAIRYRLDAVGLSKTYACHCLTCQTWSGSAFSLQFIAPETALHVTGEPAIYERLSDDGQRLSRQRGCPICFTRIYNTNSSRPGLVIIRAGTLDDSHEQEIAAHIWVKRKLKGIDIPPGIPTWPESAPPEDFRKALAG
jgi:hypothetical protein